MIRIIGARDTGNCSTADESIKASGLVIKER
jgi:hypothetical protein